MKRHRRLCFICAVLGSNLTHFIGLMKLRSYSVETWSCYETAFVLIADAFYTPGYKIPSDDKRNPLIHEVRQLF